MMKWLIKKMIPSSEKLADMAASAIRDAVNSLPEDRAAQIAKGSAITAQANKVLTAVTKWLADGKVDDTEMAELKRALQPLVELVMAKI